MASISVPRPQGATDDHHGPDGEAGWTRPSSKEVGGLLVGAIVLLGGLAGLVVAVRTVRPYRGC